MNAPTSITITRSVSSTGHRLVTSGVMRGALKRQKRVSRCYGRRVRGPNPDLGSPRPIARLVGDPRPPGRHDRGPRNYLSVYVEWSRKVSASKGGRDVAHMVSDRRDSSCVSSTACIEDDASTILKVLKDVGRRILIDAHDHLTACLHGRECGVGAARGRVSHAPARGECEHEGSNRHDRHLCSVPSGHGRLPGA